MILHKTLLCHHSKKNKTSLKYKNTKCSCKLDIIVKKVNHNTKKNDALLKLETPMCCVITISRYHNHNIDVAASSKFLKVSKETKARFVEYFNKGLTPAAAMHHHATKLLAKAEDEGYLATADLENSSINPRSSSVYNLYNKWRVDNFGMTEDPMEKLKELISFFRSIGNIF